MDKVSRSFALCIQQLKSPLRDWVSLMYLLCRIIDTGEDVPWLHKESRDQFFTLLREKLTDINNKDLLLPTDELFLKKVDPDELQLLKAGETLFKDFHDLPKNVQEVLLNLITSMSLGMQFFLDHYSENNRIKITTYTELNQYCFYVAGIVGEALTRLVAGLEKREVNNKELLQAYHFGLFLQKINILKDQWKDESQNRFFVTDRKRLRASLSLHAEESFEYILQISDQFNDYKIFCAWSFFLGLASLKYIDKSYNNKNDVKIPRLKTLTLMQKIEKIANDNRALTDIYHCYRDKYLV
ncbi:MAG: squalene/phytoene synthase family protein, partial [Bdellovibrionales bacterium]|nr:squalene/phytoene synthase family protein [Bdellovibrionales bacterium]